MKADERTASGSVITFSLSVKHLQTMLRLAVRLTVEAAGFEADRASVLAARLPEEQDLELAGYDIAILFLEPRRVPDVKYVMADAASTYFGSCSFT